MTNPSKSKTVSLFTEEYYRPGVCNGPLLLAGIIQAAMDRVHNEATEAAVGAAVRGWWHDSNLTYAVTRRIRALKRKPRE